MIFELILILTSLVWCLTSLNAILKKKSNSLGDYIIIIIYVFNCFPLLLDVLLGKPNYLIYPWYSYFEIATNNTLVNNVYNVYVFLVLIVIKIYLMFKNKKPQNKLVYKSLNVNYIKSNVLLYISFIPILLVILFGNYKEYLIFQSYTLRGLTGIQAILLVFFELLGLFCFYCWFFRDKEKLYSYLLLLLYSAMIIWIDGKRYLIVTIIILFIYFYQNSIYSIKKKLPLKTILFLLSFIFLFIYVFIAITYKVSTTNPIPEKGLMYLNYRIDFGRDDVTKFVLYKELIEKSSILDYRLQSFLSALLFWIPRSLWATKPYPHYRYLTSELFGTSPETLHSGMTPSLFEMSVANLGVSLGILFTVFFLLYLIYRADKVNSVPLKVLYLLLMIALLTQSLDAILPVLILIPTIRIIKIRI